MAKRTGTQLNSEQSIALLYMRKLNVLKRELTNAVSEEIIPLLQARQQEYALDSLSYDIGAIFEKLYQKFTGAAVLSFAQTTAENMVGEINQSSKRKVGRSIKKLFGTDLTNVIESENLQDFIDTSIRNHVQLIKTLPTEYFKQIETIVNQGLVSGTRFNDIKKQIIGIDKSANSKLAGRIKTIAMDQTQTVTQQINLRRTAALGVTKGVYRTSKDRRVRKCHAELEGQEFELTKGAWSKTCQKYIQPGITDINCRCSFSPVIEV